MQWTADPILLQWGRDLEVAESVSDLAKQFSDFLASMGPRLGSRGKSYQGAEPSRISKLQWGRDLEVAESFHVFSLAKRIFWASMGPRLGSRGKNKHLDHVGNRWLRFNGAATWKSRKADRLGSFSGVHFGFNGAATWKSRKDPN